MKITRQKRALVEQLENKKLLESLLEADEVSNDELVIDDVKAASVEKIADVVQDAAEVASDGKKTFSDKNAEDLAQTLKTYAKGPDRTQWAPLDIPNKLTDKLDKCLANSLLNKKLGTTFGTNLLVSGLPGSGKTAIVRQWAKDRGVNLMSINAKNNELDATLNGFPIHEENVKEDGTKLQKIVHAFSDSLSKLDRERSVLFLDEFNRSDYSIRASLLTLINEHRVAGEDEEGYHPFDNLLFTVTCINPPEPCDPGAQPLLPPEMDRFKDDIEWDSDIAIARKYLHVRANELIKELDPNSDIYGYAYKRIKSMLNTGTRILNHPDFEFTGRNDYNQLGIDQKSIISQRGLIDTLYNHPTKEEFLDWVDGSSRLAQKQKEMFHRILDNWVEPVVDVPNSTANNETTDSNQTQNDTAADAGRELSFDDIIGDGVESDVDLFTSGEAGTTGAAKAYRVGADVAAQRIKNFDFSL